MGHPIYAHLPYSFIILNGKSHLAKKKKLPGYFDSKLIAHKVNLSFPSL